MSEILPPHEPPKEHALVDSVLLIDGDNDPHFPADFQITPRTLVRVFLRPQAKMPRGLERKLGALPLCVSVSSPKGGANAADFVMSLHAGILHATLPLHIPFTVVTHDKSLAVMCQEFQRIGRQAVIWTSHPERGGGRRRGSSSSSSSEAPRAERAPRSSSGRRRRGSRSGRGRSVASEAPPPVVDASMAPPSDAAAPLPADLATSRPPDRSLEEIASVYAARLGRIKDPPSRLKTLLNDIKNRTAAAGHTPEAILEELKRAHGVMVDENGRVSLAARGGN